MKQGTVEKIVNGGWGLIRSDDGVVFVNYAVPGEEVCYRIKDRARGILWGEVIEVLSPSIKRVTPPCPYFGQCGGCVFQHMDYSHQLSLKRDILKNDLERIGGFKTRLPKVIQSPPYNNRVRARMKGYDDGRIGFIRKGTNTVLPIDECLLFPEPVNQFLLQWNALPEPPFFHQLDIFFNPTGKKIYIYLSRPPGESVTTLLKKEFPGIVFSWKGNEEAGVSQLNINGQNYYVSPDVFFQVNPHQWENMLNTVDRYLEPSGTMIDLYCGVGFFIPLLRNHSGTVIGVENYGFSIQLARRTFPGVQFKNMPAEKFHFPPADVIITDPPRSGLSKQVMNRIIAGKTKKIIYVSCSSASFARDLNLLVENGYRLEDLTIFDLFPQTPHLETISLFTRGE
ncbi:MAG: class I SAM-dependent RNA methyltransferase [bacterium]|nr:class I SAM-dependent RNA methyltransferase [bacterium]